jgi:hypothetical protein
MLCQNGGKLSFKQKQILFPLCQSKASPVSTTIKICKSKNSQCSFPKLPLLVHFNYSLKYNCSAPLTQGPHSNFTTLTSTIIHSSPFILHDSSPPSSFQFHLDTIASIAKLISNFTLHNFSYFQFSPTTVQFQFRNFSFRSSLK